MAHSGSEGDRFYQGILYVDTSVRKRRARREGRAFFRKRVIQDPREHHSNSFRGLSQIHFGLVTGNTGM